MYNPDLFDIIILISMLALITVLYIGVGIYVAWYTL